MTKQTQGSMRVRYFGRQLASAVLLAACSWSAVAEVVVTVTDYGGKVRPIAIVPFGWQGVVPPLKIADVVSADLARTGRFAPLAENEMLQKPTIGSEIDFSDWRILNTEAVVVGRANREADGRFNIRFWVYDVLRQDLMLGYQMTTSADDMRMAAHEISDLIYEKLTGVKGIAATQIAYVSVQGGAKNRTYRLHVSDSDGENERVLLRSSQPIMSPSWSPDGRKLAYVSFENNRSEVWVQELRSGARRRVSARKGVNSAPVWSPDGRMLALTLSKGDGNLDIYTLVIARQLLTRITNWSSIETEPSWSADGKSIYFTSDRSGGPQVYRVSASGGSPQRVTFEGNYNARPRVAPDGSKIAVVHNDRGNYRIAVVDPDRAYTQVLTKGRLDESPSFAPNGETIIYAAREGQQGWLSTVSADGKYAQKIASVSGEVREPAWSPFLIR